jgi:hypothetical protein
MYACLGLQRAHGDLSSAFWVRNSIAEPPNIGRTIPVVGRGVCVSVGVSLVGGIQVGDIDMWRFQGYVG